MKTGFVDFHSHGCWGIDDGVQTRDEAVFFLKTAVDTGMKTVFCTPHMMPNGKFDNDRESILEAVQRLRELSVEQGIDLEVRHGSELYLNDDALTHVESGKILTLEGTNCLLVEFNRHGADWAWVNRQLYEIARLGYQLLIAHPERYFSDTKVMDETVDLWLAEGYWMQVNSTSLLGMQGDRVAKNAWRLLEGGKIHLIASDAHHGQDRRTCRLDDIYATCVRRIGEERSDRLFYANPQKVLNQQPIMTIEASVGWIDRILQRISLK